MGLQQSKDELLYQQVNCGNINGVKTLLSEGAKLEYVDREGKTPLMAACLNPALHNVVKTLIELGANVNAYRRGRNGGTALHHAAKRGLDDNVNLLLSHGANALYVNDDGQTALDIARAKGFTNVVRAIENHICLYSGWLREPYGLGFVESLAPQLLGFVEVLAPQLLSKKVWAVVHPSGSRNPRKPFKLELAIYATAQDAQPRLKIDLWRATMEEPTFNQPDPAVIITETSVITRRGRQRRCKPRRVNRTQTCIKLAASNESDKQQLQQFCNACKGIPQVAHSNFPFNNASPTAPTIPPTVAPTKPMSTDDPEDLELAMAISASLQSAKQPHTPPNHFHNTNGASSSIAVFHSTSSITHEPEPSSIKGNSTPNPSKEVVTPSAPGVTDESEMGPIQYPTIDSNVMRGINTSDDERMNGKSSSCAICFDAPVEAACVPCGHMSGCMSCLTEIKAKSFGCPVCRAKIDQVIKVYSV